MLAATSACFAPWFRRGCTSVLANTPHREAMGYNRSLSRLSRSSSSVVTLRSIAIWSMKAPVPPGQEPFIRSSMPPSKKIIFASSPPSSTTAEASGSRRRTTSPVAKTSWTKGIPALSASPSPAEPEIAAVKGRLPTRGAAPSSSSRVFWRTWEKCRW